MPKDANFLKKGLAFAKWMIFHASSRNEELSQSLAENFTKTAKQTSFLEKFPVSAKSMIFHAFLPNEQLCESFGRKVHENAETC